MRKSIAIDMDNVIADAEMQFINWYERDYGVRMKKEAMLGIPETQAFPNKDAIIKFLNTPGFFRTIPVIEGAKEALNRLANNFDIYIVSAAMEFPLSLSEKYDWLKEHFPYISWTNIIFCGDKSKIGTDYMIDDHVKNLDYFKGKALLFTASHNVAIDRHTRVNDWREAVELLENELLQNSREVAL